MTTYLIGSDPELFISEGPKFISAYGLFPGTKQEPFKVEKGAIQVDGMALEFNIDPAKTDEEFHQNIETVLAQMNEMVRQVNPDFRLNFRPVAKFDAEEFESFPDEAKLLGCDPDFNIHGDVNTPPEDFMWEPMRTGSGHIHIGWTNGVDPFHPEHFSDCLAVARYFHHNNPIRITAEEQERLKYYGGNGAFRPKPYGIELRGPSNIWVEREESRKEMFNLMQKTMNDFRNEM